jgi:hypothetical protein
MTASKADVDALTAAALSQLTGTTVLNCMGKQPGPPTLAGDLAHIIDLPEVVRDDLWSVLEPNLSAINTPHSNQAVESYCERHQLDPQAITPVIGACRFLFLRGAEHNTPPALIEEDIKRLLADEKGDAGEIDAVLGNVMPCYERAAPKLRVKAIYEALTDHGKVVTDVKWRVDDVSHANTGEAINVPVAMVTLRYAEGDQTGQITVQLLPAELKKLHAACEQALR